MSVADSGPYKSRLFNFISHSAQKLTDEGSRTWRYFKFATEVVLQTALYPVYFLLQTVRVTTQKLGTVIQDRLPQLGSEKNSNPSDTDTPIVHLLEQVATETESLLSNSIISQPEVIEIQGIASQIDSQALVLVKSDNEIVDNLPIEQQHHLQEQIGLEIARFDPHFTQPQLPPLLPVRWFSQVMSWVQTSPVAMKINCFGESNLADAVSFPVPSPQFIHSLDGAIAQVEDYSILPLSQATHSLVQQSQTFGKTVIQVWQYPSHSPLSVQSESHLQPRVDEYFYKIQSLILAAVDYFFGDHQASIPSQENSQPVSGVITASESTLSPQPSSLEDPWLTTDDLTNTILVKLQKPKPRKSRPTSSNPISETNNKIRDKVQSSLSRFKTQQTSEPILSASPIPTQSLTKSQNYAKESPEIAIASSQATSPEAKPDWLEAKVTATGYIKHPLEQILGWLDQMMVKVEGVITKIWSWLTQYRKH